MASTMKRKRRNLKRLVAGLNAALVTYQLDSGESRIPKGLRLTYPSVEDFWVGCGIIAAAGGHPDITMHIKYRGVPLEVKEAPAK